MVEACIQLINCVVLIQQHFIVQNNNNNEIDDMCKIEFYFIVMWEVGIHFCPCKQIMFYKTACSTV